MRTKQLFQASGQDQRRIEADEFIDGVSPLPLIASVIAIVMLGIATVVYSQNQWTGLLYGIVGAAQLIVAGSGYMRLKRRTNATRAGNVVVQHSWIIGSVGIAVLAMATSDFYAVDTIWMMMAVAVGAVWVLISALGIYVSTQSVDARLTV